MNEHVHVFTRNGALFECTCETQRAAVQSAILPTARSGRFWTIRMQSCEVRGPACTGKEFLDEARTRAFEDLAVKAVRSCTKPCAVPFDGVDERGAENDRFS